MGRLTMSERSDLAERLATVIRNHRMTNPFGGDVVKGTRSYDILFAFPATMDGLVQVYGPKFIRINCVGRAAPSGGWNAVYTSEKDATDFLVAVAECRHTDAMEIPTKDS